ncbi:mitogen-activated protein kinase kinase kinase 7-like [Aphidius gifuensis]|uniref:mitogen-activated protein kinase kinase kinase 7-like n=1 Tax=Aphidius gifuensis TaxID=684658 RepID=UPI001CDB77CB|nr:mitogen-activated protein kinase kinase kinase 7-like [Aphidius gifuensis]
MSINITDDCCNNQHELQTIQMTDNKQDQLSVDLLSPALTATTTSTARSSLMSTASTQTSQQQQTQVPKLKSPNQQSFAKEIDYNEIEIKEVVGKGSFGVVRKGRWRNIDVAIKHINTESERIAFGIELVQLSRVSHPNIVRLYGACTKNPVCLVMEYAEGGSLYNVLHCSPKPHYTAGHAISWAVQCAQGVAYLHNMKPKPLIHRDLKPPNLLLVSGGRILKICDFGTACDLNTYMTNNKGSAAWMAPVFEGSRYTEKCDIFSWGVILWEVLTRQKPFDDIGGSAYRIMWAVHTGQRPPLIEGCPKPIEYLITRCWAKEPEQRPSMNEIVRIMINLSELFNCDLEPVEYTPSSSINVEYINDNNETNDDTINITWDTSNSQFNGDNSASYNQFNQNQLDISESIKNLQSNITMISTGEQQTRQDNKINTSRPPLPPMASSTKLSTISSINCNNFQPLHVECDPTSWDLATSSDTSWELGSTAGLDKMRPKSKKSISKSSDSSNTDQLDEVYRLLDADLRPLEPDVTCQISKDIFEEHKQLATEYFKVQTEIALIGREKMKMLNSLSPDGLREQQELRKLEDEKESLVKLYRNLQRQLEIMKGPIGPGTVLNPTVQTPGNDGWVLVSRQEPSRIL